MCGICGIFDREKRVPDLEDLRRMCEVMVHRGPDDEGYYTSDHVGLGMRRLKIIDLETGHQPIHNEDKTIWVILNGEIYNFLELRSKLEALGHKFYTRSDTEVIAHLYEEYGEDSVSLLNGMFGFALWDVNNEKLFIARDRLGIKQIYYAEDGERFVFGSEIKTILAMPGINREINYEAICDFFSLQYIPAPRTAFRCIKKLPPACNLTIDYKGKVIKKYWDLQYDENGVSDAEAVDFIDQELQRAVRYQMISDVPLGAYLSGGIDSSLLVAMMAQASDRPVETFSILWDQGGEAFDERTYSRFVVEKFKTNHHEFLVKPQVEEIMDAIVQSFDEPFADDSAVPNYYIAHETRKHVTVALSGLGGDEMSAGYERYLGMRLLRYYRYLPAIMRREIIRIVNRIPDPDSGSLWVERIKRFSMISDLPFARSYYAISSKLNPNEKPMLFTAEALEKIGNDYDTGAIFDHLSGIVTHAHELNQMLFIDMNTYMVDQLLVLSDRMSMAHSLELRVPYLDHHLVESFARVHPTMKLRGPIKKYLLKKVAERYFPKGFIYRKKMGFSSPMVVWLRGDLKPYMLALLDKKHIAKTGILNPESVQGYVRMHLERRRNYDMLIWSIMMFMLWYDSYIDKIYNH